MGATSTTDPFRHHLSLPPGCSPRWYRGGRLPHLDAGPVPMAVTFRLADSIPQAVLDKWKIELSVLPPRAAAEKRRRRIEAALDRGWGAGVLARPALGAVVEHALLRGEGVAYSLHSWVVMPNHVHVLFTPAPGAVLPEILRRWKGASAVEINRALGQEGRLWQPEYFDRVVRHDGQFEAAIGYIEANPVKARLCRRPEEWALSSARRRGGCGAGAAWSEGFSPRLGGFSPPASRGRPGAALPGRVLVRAGGFSPRAED